MRVLLPEKITAIARKFSPKVLGKDIAMMNARGDRLITREEGLRMIAARQNRPMQPIA